jgi:hypothetical protein
VTLDLEGYRQGSLNEVLNLVHSQKELPAEAQRPQRKNKIKTISPGQIQWTVV